MSEAEEEPAYRPPPDDGDAEEEEAPTVEELEARLAEGHMLSGDELEQLKSAAADDANATAEALSEKLASGHMLTADEKEELNAAVVLSSGHTADTLTAKLAAGHMLTADEKEELREATATKAAATADALGARLAAGHMLSDAELEQLKAAATTTASTRADALAAKLAGGHMLTADELAELRGNAAVLERPKTKHGGRGRPKSRGGPQPIPPALARGPLSLRRPLPPILGASRPERVQLLAATAGLWWWEEELGPPGLTRSNASSGGGGSGAASSRPSRPEWVDAAAPALPMGRGSAPQSERPPASRGKPGYPAIANASRRLEEAIESQRAVLVAARSASWRMDGLVGWQIGWRLGWYWRRDDARGDGSRACAHPAYWRSERRLPRCVHGTAAGRTKVRPRVDTPFAA